MILNLAGISEQPALTRTRANCRGSGAVVVLFSFMLNLVVAGCSEDDPTGPPPVPVVSTVSSLTVEPGDTLVIGGNNFMTPPGDNRVYFASPFGRAIPYAATKTRLSVVVPENAASGPVSVTVSEQPVAGVGPPVEVSREIGEVWVFGGVNANYKLRLPNPVSTAEYLLIPHSTNAGSPYTQVHSYTITPEETSGYPAPPARSEPLTPGRAAPLTMTIGEEFDRILRDAAGQFAETMEGVFPARPKDRPAGHAPAQFRQFNVFDTYDGNPQDPAYFSQVTAELRYTGTHCIIYTDVDTLQTGNLTFAQLTNLGEEFDQQIRPTNAMYFGTESDIDSNERVIILITPVVNRLTPKGSNEYIGGFFMPIDLFSPGGNVSPGTTNFAEIFYVLASDPGGFWSLEFPDTFVAETNQHTIAHEYQHLISISFRIFNYGLGYVQATWLEEGMAHMSEDLNGINASNVARANSYLDDPGNVSLEHNFAPIEQRGGIYLFLRYLGDRFGETIYKTILQSTCVGRACIENITGENFYETVDDFLATLYLSGKGITASSAYNYSSIDLSDFSSVTVQPRSVGAGATSGTIVRTSGDFYLFTNTNSAASNFTLVDLTGAGLRTVVVRTK